jgi:hypothetical protein
MVQRVRHCWDGTEGTRASPRKYEIIIDATRRPCNQKGQPEGAEEEEGGSRDRQCRLHLHPLPNKVLFIVFIHRARLGRGNICTSLPLYLSAPLLTIPKFQRTELPSEGHEHLIRGQSAQPGRMLLPFTFRLLPHLVKLLPQTPPICAQHTDCTHPRKHLPRDRRPGRLNKNNNRAEQRRVAHTTRYLDLFYSRPGKYCLCDAAGHPQ